MFDSLRLSSAASQRTLSGLQGESQTTKAEGELLFTRSSAPPIRSSKIPDFAPARRRHRHGRHHGRGEARRHESGRWGGGRAVPTAGKEPDHKWLHSSSLFVGHVRKLRLKGCCSSVLSPRSPACRGVRAGARFTHGGDMKKWKERSCVIRAALAKLNCSLANIVSHPPVCLLKMRRIVRSRHGLHRPLRCVVLPICVPVFSVVRRQ